MSYRFTVVKRGYNPDEVDTFIQGLESALKNYKEKEVAIKNAFINAQVAADKIIQEAQDDAAEMKRNTIYQLEAIKNSVEEQKIILSSFQNDYNRLIRKYLYDVNTSEFDLLVGKINVLTESIQGLITSSKNVKPLLYDHDLSSTRVYDKVETPAHSDRLTPERMEVKTEEVIDDNSEVASKVKPLITPEENEALRGLFK